MTAFGARFHQRNFLKRYANRERAFYTRVKRRTMRTRTRPVRQKTFAEKKLAREKRAEFNAKVKNGIAKLHASLTEGSRQLWLDNGQVHTPRWYYDKVVYGAPPAETQPERRVTTWNAMVHMEKVAVAGEIGEDGQGTYLRILIDASPC